MPNPSTTTTERFVAKGRPAGVDWGDPFCTCTVAAAGVFVKEKLAGASPPVEARTANGPEVSFAVNAGAVAMPEGFVTAIVETDPANAPEAPVDGAVNVTATFAIGLPPASSTRATMGEENDWPTVADCADPEETLMDPATARAGPSVTLVDA